MPRPTLKSISNENVDALAANSQGIVPNPALNSLMAISAAEFADLLVPFSSLLNKQTPLAIAVSGGADSMALVLLAERWARQTGHCIVALTVDHGLRAAAAAEAATVAEWLTARNIAHHILVWQGDKPTSAIQAAAREARYRLMADWCQEQAITALMTAHHLEDQAETFLLRAERGSGLDGLACMAPQRAGEAMVLLRPLLGVAKDRLRAGLLEQGQPWLEDPSNQNPYYQRTRMRALVHALAQRNLPAQKIVDVTGLFALLRQQMADVVTLFFSRAVRVFPTGYGEVQLALLQKLPAPILERVLVRLTAVFGGKPYPPRRDRLRRAMAKIQAVQPSGFTLGGCRFVRKSNAIMICRDRRAISTIQVTGGAHFTWDNLCAIEISGDPRARANLAPLGRDGWLEIVHKNPELKGISVPYPVRLTLPALLDRHGVVEVPQLNYRRDGQDSPDLTISRVCFDCKDA